MNEQNIHNYFSTLASELDGVYMGYSSASGAMNLKLDNGRNQSVKGFVKNEKSGDRIVFMSKVCRLDDYPDLDFRSMLEMNHNLTYSKIVIDQGYMEVESDAKIHLSSRAELKYIVKEVAKVADNLEQTITGKDEF